MEIELEAERQAPERTEHPLEIDYQELADYAHNPRCYYWSSWLGLRPPKTHREVFEEACRKDLHAWYDQYPDGYRGLGFPYPLHDWRTMTRCTRAIGAYTASPSTWDRLRGRKYFSRPLGSTLSYGGLLEASVLVEGTLWFVIHKFSEHRTDSDSFVDRFKGSPEFLGLHWVGRHAWRLMKEDGTIHEDVRYGGIILDGIQITKTIDRRITTYLIPTEYQIEQFVRNAFVMGEEIVRRRKLTKKHLEMKEPARNAWPNWPTHGEHFCPWKALNVADSIEAEEDFLDTCTTDPWWIRREG